MPAFPRREQLKTTVSYHDNWQEKAQLSCQEVVSQCLAFKDGAGLDRTTMSGRKVEVRAKLHNNWTPSNPWLKVNMHAGYMQCMLKFKQFKKVLFVVLLGLTDSKGRSFPAYKT